VTPSDKSVPLDQDFTLKLEQSAVIDAENFNLRFASVLEDSRCPRNVACVWQGQAQIALFAKHKDNESPQLRLTIVGERPQNDTRLLVWSGYTIEFKALSPYPGDGKPKSNSEATLNISKK
jgi:hypothetical protein